MPPCALNTSENTNVGGYFIATFYNGNKLFDLLKDKEGIEYINKSDDKVYEMADISSKELTEFIESMNQQNLEDILARTHPGKDFNIG